MKLASERETRILQRSIITPEGWQDTKAGMWAWLVVRASAVFLVLLVAAHLVYPYAVSVQFLLLLSLTFHGTLGVRVILLDLGVVTRFQKALSAGLLVLGLVVFLLVWWGRS